MYDKVVGKHDINLRSLDLDAPTTMSPFVTYSSSNQATTDSTSRNEIFQQNKYGLDDFNPINNYITSTTLSMFLPPPIQTTTTSTTMATTTTTTTLNNSILLSKLMLASSTLKSISETTNDHETMTMLKKPNSSTISNTFIKLSPLSGHNPISHLQQTTTITIPQQLAFNSRNKFNQIQRPYPFQFYDKQLPIQPVSYSSNLNRYDEMMRQDDIVLEDANNNNNNNNDYVYNVQNFNRNSNGVGEVDEDDDLLASKYGIQPLRSQINPSNGK